MTQHTVDSWEFGDTKQLVDIRGHLFFGDSGQRCVIKLWLRTFCFSNRNLIHIILFVISRHRCSGTTEIKLKRKRRRKLIERESLIDINIKQSSSAKHFHSREK